MLQLHYSLHRDWIAQNAPQVFWSNTVQTWALTVNMTNVNASFRLDYKKAFAPFSPPIRNAPFGAFQLLRHPAAHTCMRLFQNVCS